MKYSIIIPTAFDSEERLRNCLESVKTFTDLSKCEVIVVANGCSANTLSYLRRSGVTGIFSDNLPIWAIVNPEAIGFPAAINLGAKRAKGEFLILLNDDTILLEQERNMWLDMLAQPFSDPSVAVTGAWMNWCPYAERDFLIFFCVMIRKTIFDQLGCLDESFGAGYGED